MLKESSKFRRDPSRDGGQAGPPHPGPTQRLSPGTHANSRSSNLPPRRAPFASAVRRWHRRRRSKERGRRLSVPAPGPGKTTARRRCARGSREPVLGYRGTPGWLGSGTRPPLRQGQASLGRRKKRNEERLESKKRQGKHYQAAGRIASKCRRKSRVCPVPL